MGFLSQACGELSVYEVPLSASAQPGLFKSDLFYIIFEGVKIQELENVLNFTEKAQTKERAETACNKTRKKWGGKEPSLFFPNYFFL